MLIPAPLGLTLHNDLTAKTVQLHNDSRPPAKYHTRQEIISVARDAEFRKQSSTSTGGRFRFYTPGGRTAPGTGVE